MNSSLSNLSSIFSSVASCFYPSFSSASSTMSEDLPALYYNHGYHDEKHSNITTSTAGFPFSTTYSPYWHIDYGSMADSSQILDNPSPYQGFSECLFQGSFDYDTVADAFGLSSSLSSSEAFYPVEDDKTLMVATDGGYLREYGAETQVTTNSSISSMSMEANKDNKKEKQVKENQETGKSPMKVNNSKKKGEKKNRQPRFAFMTKSEVDHLEDGYRWRKYGQKTVKSSTYPRNYYRCATEKCDVKKQVERSFQDPSIVITTYEGLHNHDVPTSRRGMIAAMLAPSSLTPSPLAGSTFLPVDGGSGSASGGSSMFQPTLTPFQHVQFSGNGLLQDIVPSMFPKPKP